MNYAPGFDYPTAEQAGPACLNVLENENGTYDGDQCCLQKCYWTVCGFAKRMQDECCTMQASPSVASVRNCTTKDDFKDALRHLADCAAKKVTASGFNWQQFIAMMIQILLQLFPPTPTP